MVFNETQIRPKLANYPAWTISGQSLRQDYQFKDFIQAIEFINRLVEPSEAMGHHPDISISYNKVIINLMSHDAGGITQKDFDLAAQIDKIANDF